MKYILLNLLILSTALSQVDESQKSLIVQSNLIFSLDKKPTPEAHAPSIVETDDGLLATWFGGSREKNTDTAIYTARFKDKKWSVPKKVFDGSEGESEEFACWNPVLFKPTNGPLMLFYKVGESPRTWWGMLSFSQDDGKSWSKPKKLGRDKKIGHLTGPTKNKPIQLRDGTIICPASTEQKVNDASL